MERKEGRKGLSQGRKERRRQKSRISCLGLADQLFLISSRDHRIRIPSGKSIELRTIIILAQSHVPEADLQLSRSHKDLNQLLHPARRHFLHVLLQQR